MSLSQAFRPLRIPRLAKFVCQCVNQSRFPRDPPFLAFARNATSLSQGRANGPKNGPGKRLGAKKGSEEYVIPGNIIFRQRGTLWHPGENCAMGRDHTIYATQPGYVKFYRDPHQHPKRRYIGVAFERSTSLPTPPNAPRRRRLGMLAVPMAGSLGAGAGGSSSATAAAAAEEEEEMKTALQDWQPPRIVQRGPVPPVDERTRLSKMPRLAKRVAEKTYVMKSDYSFRETNWEIGRTAEKKKVHVKPFKPGDRFAAWRKVNKRKEANAEKRSLRRKKA